MYAGEPSGDRLLRRLARAQKLRRARDLEEEEVDVENLQTGKRFAGLSHILQQAMPAQPQQICDAARPQQFHSPNPASPAKRDATAGRGEEDNLESVGTGKRSCTTYSGKRQGPREAFLYCWPLSNRLYKRLQLPLFESLYSNPLNQVAHLPKPWQ